MQLLRIASVLFFLHICYHPRLYVSSAPIKDSFNSDISDNAEEEIQTHSNDEHDNAVTKIFNSTTFANITNSLLRSDSYNTTNAFDLSTKRSMPYVIWISMKSWEKYHTFLRETCRTIKEETPKFGGQDVLENGYFKWEENEFHRELRVLLFPETSNTLKPLVDNGMIDKLDKRFLQKPLESFCYRKEAKHTKEEAIADEKAKFEDIVLNR
uniref:Uncharacterized protein n=1 Tax=Panagrolaimus superbus TaxID=310955 RepID=A0A914YT94_9BILA